jgi:UDP-N-acetylglucosamine--N-acetylmuramyl-(pentapeptide) pyrophosphoryl-undecaprenol N-acetylglucosamine transferase
MKSEPLTIKGKVLIAAGGTGGHLFPAQQLADMLKGEAEILFAGHKIGTSPFFEKEKIPFVEISAHPLKRGFLRATWKGFWQSVKLLRRFKPDVVVGFGSFHTFPLLLAAVFSCRKLVLFEANCLLGKVNRLFACMSHAVAVQFPVQVKKGVMVPLLPWRRGDGPLAKQEARKKYGLQPNRKTILVFGGSQGAAFLNEWAPTAIAQMSERCQVIHLTGLADRDRVFSEYQKLGIDACVKAFENEMMTAYSAADLAFCRSGAGTIAELIRFEIPSLLIPYPFATDDHQRKNGRFLTERLQGARMLIQSEATLDRLVAELDRLNREIDERRIHLQNANQEQGSRISLAEIVRRVGGWKPIIS